MFVVAPWMGTAPVGQPVATSPAAVRNHHDGRSRSPHGSSGSHVSDVPSPSARESYTGFAVGDIFFDQHVFEAQIRQEFLEIPVETQVYHREVHGEDAR